MGARDTGIYAAAFAPFTSNYGIGKRNRATRSEILDPPPGRWRKAGKRAGQGYQEPPGKGGFPKGFQCGAEAGDLACSSRSAIDRVRLTLRSLRLGTKSM
jgi:hypothetical protein